jgi:hypothetical protein
MGLTALLTQQDRLKSKIRLHRRNFALQTHTTVTVTVKVTVMATSIVTLLLLEATNKRKTNPNCPLECPTLPMALDSRVAAHNTN